jgi:hypothetical protein
MACDLAAPNCDYPRHRRIALDPAASASNSAAAQDDDLVTDRFNVVGVGAKLVPDVGYLSEVGTYPGVAVVAAALNPGAGQRKELDIGVIQLQQSVHIASRYRGKTLPHNLHVLLRHRPRSISRAPMRVGARSEPVATVARRVDHGDRGRAILDQLEADAPPPFRWSERTGARSYWVNAQGAPSAGYEAALDRLARD